MKGPCRPLMDMDGEIHVRQMQTFTGLQSLICAYVSTVSDLWKYPVLATAQVKLAIVVG